MHMDAQGTPLIVCLIPLLPTCAARALLGELKLSVAGPYTLEARGICTQLNWNSFGFFGFVRMRQ